MEASDGAEARDEEEGEDEDVPSLEMRTLARLTRDRGGGEDRETAQKCGEARDRRS